MELYNKGARGFIVKREEAVAGCRLPEDVIGRERAYIDPGSTVEVTDECADRLLKLYPKELVALGRNDRERRIQKALKKVDADKKKQATRKKAPAKPKKKPEAKKKKR